MTRELRKKLTLYLNIAILILFIINLTKKINYSFILTKIMNQFKEIYNTIEKLLNDKSISNYRINQDTGVSYGGISELRSGKRKVKNLTLETAEKLYNYQKQLEIMIED
ncbi:Uncharacterised protein [Staphylococcus aureus]|nr:Uncharacterised protein [Staphylococcus aureus]CAC7161755.1 Uncharacterised protein [Staphylococcus aureus]CAC7185007.1 Uncharacterised protein [Staphylococcus aureus]CAC7217661.1 Uncharacterised protein [Staphylococcus aureus]CAC8124959.1 Uncharacterised protein [Staphylococcus aureus]